MTASELLALLGLAWWRLLIYPGGLAVALALWLTARRTRRQASGGSRQESGDIRSPRHPVTPSPRHLLIAAPWLALALLPLPGTRTLARPLDLLVTLALLDAPLLVVLAAALRAPGAGWRAAGRRLAALLNGYPVLILAALLAGGGALTFDALTALPAATAPRGTAAHWFGAVTLLLALPALLGLGPFAAQIIPQTRILSSLSRFLSSVPYPLVLVLQTFVDDSWVVALWLRAIGLVLVAALPWLALLDAWPWLLPLPPLVIAALLWGFHHAVGGTARRWAWGYAGLAALQLLALAVMISAT